MIRVLHVFGKLDRGGAESRTMDIYRAIDRERIQFDFAVHTRAPCAYDQEALSLGGRIFSLPRYKVYNRLAYRRAWKRLLTEHPEIQTVHIHTTNIAHEILPVLAKQAIPVRIVHARSASSAGMIRKIIVRLHRPVFNKKSTFQFAVTEDAGRHVFGEKMVRAGGVTVVRDAIPVSLYQYDASKRRQMRERLGLGDELVVGHVGRFHPTKNHAFLIRVLAELHKTDPKTKLVLVGDGALFNEIKDKISELKLAEHVLLLGERSDVPDILQAFDVFALPSHFEGLPGVITEALVSGLPCVISEKVSRNCAFVPELCRFLPIKDAGLWAQQIFELKDMPRVDRSEDITRAGFDIQDQIRWFERLYTGQDQRTAL